MARIGDEIFRPIMRALDDAPVHLRQLRGAVDGMKAKQIRNRDGVTDIDKPIDKPSTPNKPDAHHPTDGDNRPYLKPGSRPSLRKGTVRDAWENAKGPDGKVREPYPPYSVIDWTPGTSRRGVWDMGHVPGQKYHEKWQAYVDGEMTPAEFRDWYNDAAHYRPELPGPNRGHRHE